MGCHHSPLFRSYPYDCRPYKPGKVNTAGDSENTELKKNGFYKISRNPIYLGFNLFSLAAVLSVGDFVVLIVALYSIVVYHLIILAEEKFLEYKKNVRRYI